MLENKIEELLNSIQEDCASIEEVIVNSNLLFIAEKYLEEHNQEYAVRSKILRLRQKRRYNVFRFAIKEFLLECDTLQVRPVFMKGIFLAADLYERMEERPSCDIDILIRLDEFKRYYIIMKKLGYANKYNIEGESDEYENSCKELQRQHLGYVKQINQTTVSIELHIAIINSPVLFQNTADEFIDTAVQTESLGLNPFVLDLEHNLVQLAIHFFKHLTLSYFQNLLFQRKHSVNLSNLHDIALFQYKYQKQIDGNKVLDIAKRMMVVKYILFVFKLVNQIYGELFSAHFLELLSDYVYCSKMDYRNSERSGFGKLVWLLDIYLEYCKNISIKQFILGDLPDGFRLIDIAISDPSDLYCLEEGKEAEFKDNFVFPIVIRGLEQAVKVSLKVTLNSRDMALQYAVDHKECCFYKNRGEACYAMDSMEIIVIKDHCVIHRMFTISNIQDRLSLVVYSNNTEEITDIDRTEVKYFLDIRENGFALDLTVPWSFLDINPAEDRIVPFNVAALVSNPETRMQDRACAIFKKEEFIWNFQGIGGCVFERS